MVSFVSQNAFHRSLVNWLLLEGFNCNGMKGCLSWVIPLSQSATCPVTGQMSLTAVQNIVAVFVQKSWSCVILEKCDATNGWCFFFIFSFFFAPNH